jgi:serine/threonine protein kinase
MPTVTEAELVQALGPFDQISLIQVPSGSGECWRVTQGGQERVIKVIIRELEPGRFERELKGLRAVSSPRVMKVYDDGKLTAGGQEYPYVVGEFIPGGNVLENVQSSLPTDDQLRAFLVGCLEGLGDLADQRVTHRDLKPENIIVRDGDWANPVIIDLGLVRLGDTTPFTVYPWA